MTAATNIERTRAALERFAEADLEGYLQLYSDDVLFHGFPPDLPTGKQGLRIFYTGLLGAFSGAKVHLDDVLSDGDKLILRFHMTGKHTGEFIGVPPTGKEIAINGITILRFDQGVCVERWQVADMLDLLQQLGAVPAPP